MLTGLKKIYSNIAFVDLEQLGIARVTVKIPLQCNLATALSLLFLISVLRLAVAHLKTKVVAKIAYSNHDN